MLKHQRTKIFIISSLLFISNANADANLKTYESGYFSVQIPQNFTATKVTKNEATFISPDQKVEFFIYSPLWSGKPKTYLAVRQTEKIVSQNSTKTLKPNLHQNHVQTRWVTIQAKDGSFTRSFMQQRACHGDTFEDCLSHVFGIKYKNKQAYNQYKQTYIAFKKSLQQFTD